LEPYQKVAIGATKIPASIRKINPGYICLVKGYMLLNRTDAERVHKSSMTATKANIFPTE